MNERSYVLVVDDDPNIPELMGAFLDDYDIVSEGMAELAYLAINNIGHYPGLIIADEHMPGKSGSEMARDIRERGYPHRTVLMSGDWSQDIVGCEDADDFLYKPILEEDLTALVKKHFTDEIVPLPQDFPTGLSGE